jgi:hypothetical protein
MLQLTLCNLRYLKHRYRINNNNYINNNNLILYFRIKSPIADYKLIAIKKKAKDKSETVYVLETVIAIPLRITRFLDFVHPRYSKN